MAELGQCVGFPHWTAGLDWTPTQSTFIPSGDLKLHVWICLYFWGLEVQC